MANFPGVAAQLVLDLNERYYARTTATSHIVVDKGEGPIVFDQDGNQFIDLHCDAGVNNLGHCHPHIVETIIDQVKRLIFAEHHNGPNNWAVHLAYQLAVEGPLAKGTTYPKVFFSNSGTEANETARKLCRVYRVFKTKEPDRAKAIYFINGFAGRTKGSLPATSSRPEVQRDPFWDHCDKENTIYLPYPKERDGWREGKKIFDEINLSEVDRILMEVPCQGEAGIIPVGESALKYICERAQEADVIFISDCIQTGMGRVGTLFGCDIFKWFRPDILTLGKALGGGLPIGATVFRRDLDFPELSMHANTFGGHPTIARCALVALAEYRKIINSGRVEEIAAILDTRLRELYKHKFVKDVRGRGAMWGVEFSSAALRDKVIVAGEKLSIVENYGLRLLGAGQKSIRIMPPLIISDDLLNLAMDLLDKVLKALG